MLRMAVLVNSVIKYPLVLEGFRAFRRPSIGFSGMAALRLPRKAIPWAF